MGLFGRKTVTPSTVVIDPALGDETRRRLIDAASARQWEPVRDLLSAADPADRSDLVWLLADAPGTQDWLADIVRQNPASTIASLAYGVRLIAWAWEARTGARADMVSRDQFELFFERLRAAEDCLQGVVRREPDQAAAWHALIVTARGLQLDLAVARRRFDRTIAAAPGHRGAYDQLLQNLCRKWYGSHEQMFEFARGSMQQAPPGSVLGALVASAHIERWLDADDAERGKYLTRRDVRQEGLAAADRSVRHPDYPSGWQGLAGRGMFAFAFVLGQEYKAAREQFRLIGDRIHRGPWHYLGNGESGRVYGILRARAESKS